MKLALRRIIRGLPFVLGILIPVIAQSQSGVPLWTNRYNGPGNGSDLPNAIAVDTNGNVFVTGSSVGGGGLADWVTVGYSGGGVPLWTNRYNVPGSNGASPRALAVDANGNVFVTGNSYPFGGGFSDYTTIAYSGSGVPLWTNFYNGPAINNDQPNAIAVDGSGSVFVTGYSRNSNNIGEYATIAYSNAGVPLWTNRYSGLGNYNAQANAIAMDGGGNVFVTGYSYDSSVNTDFATIAYSNAGVPLWTNLYAGPGNYGARANAIAVDRSGNIFVAGYFNAPYPDPSADNYATIGYSSGGVPLWTNFFDGSVYNGNDEAKAIAVAGSGNVFVTGSSTGTNGGLQDYATIGYSNAGMPLWTNRYDGPSHNADFPSALAVDQSGNVFVTGTASGPGVVGIVTIAYSGAGASLWTNWYVSPGGGLSGGKAIAMDASGNVFVTGYSFVSGTSHDFVTIKYSAIHAPASVRVAAVVTGNQLLLSWPTNAGIWTIQATSTLSPAAWADLVPQPSLQLLGTNYQALLPVSPTNTFCRLRQ